MSVKGFTQSVGIGNSNPDASARLEVNSSNQGILIPRLTTSQRSNISHPATGLLVFQTDGTPGFYYYTGLAWINLTNGYQANNEGLAVSSNYGLTTTLAGSGASGGADGTGAAATFQDPFGIATDAAGNIYVTDGYNNKIRKITPSGVVTTLAGSGAQGATDGAGAAASFFIPLGIATDAAGNVYVADTYNNKIRKISPTAEVSTLAGTGVAGSANGAGIVASFDHPRGIATDAAGNIYVADRENNLIRKIAQGTNGTCVVTTLAGTGAAGSDDGNSTAASFNGPEGVAVNSLGEVYVADAGNNKIRKISAAGVVTTLAGDGSYGNVDGSALTASFNNPTSLTLDAYGNIYVSDTYNNTIRKITAAGIVSTLAGTGGWGSTDGIGTQASFFNQYGITTDTFGNVYVADLQNNKIRKIIIR